MSQQQLKKEIGFFAALTTVIGTVIGAGVFLNQLHYMVSLVQPV